ncbi:MAG: hypothetical protein NTY03_02215 [Candidatus Bathyarchaeota archaeon]|jgi:hypothetical protein|nr:hypothetical protein [Candidatus Bathyarchaeota archaeon]
MDDAVRKIIEGNIDNALKFPKEHEKGYRDSVAKLGIEPSLETMLSYFSGLLLGLFLAYYRFKKNCEPNIEEIDEFHDLMKRRVWELRQKLLETRLHEEK